MGRQGRFGKYGETKRFSRLRQSGIRQPTNRVSHTPAWSMRSAPMKHQDVRVRIQMREGLFSDEEFITRLSEKVFSIYGPYREMIHRWFELDTTSTFLALMDGKPAGFVMLGKMRNGSELPAVTELLAIAVEPGRQHRGIGQMLLSETEKKAALLGEKRLCLHTATDNIAAQKLFIKNAYRPCEIKRNFYPKGQDALMMVKEIEGLG